MNLKPITALFILFLLLVYSVRGHAQAQFNKSDHALNNYSFDLYRSVKAENENLFLSPLSTYYALLMLYEGAEGKTKQEFEKVLYLNKSGNSDKDYLHSLASTSDTRADFNVSNAVWFDRDIKVRCRYRKQVTKKYSSDFRQTNFKNTRQAIEDINAWVKENTHQKISEIVNDSHIDASTKLVLANAIYFKGEWLNAFEKVRTKPGIFFSGVNNQYEIDFMNKTESVLYFEDDDYQFISKPYKNSDLSFCIILSKKIFGIAAIEEQMDNALLDSILDEAYQTNTAISIPKLKLEASYELNDALKNAGLQLAFSGAANFKGISDKTSLMLGEVLHKTSIELDEEKTEAAAATAAGIRVTGTRPSYKVFNADHPFVFFVLDNNTRSILFMGRYVEPTDAVKLAGNKAGLKQNLENRKKEKFSVGSEIKEILYVVDGKTISKTEFKSINTSVIESITVIKNKEGIRKYTTGDYGGVIIIELK